MNYQTRLYENEESIKNISKVEFWISLIAFVYIIIARHSFQLVFKGSQFSLSLAFWAALYVPIECLICQKTKTMKDRYRIILCAVSTAGMLVSAIIYISGCRISIEFLISLALLILSGIRLGKMVSSCIIVNKEVNRQMTVAQVYAKQKEEDDARTRNKMMEEFTEIEKTIIKFNDTQEEITFCRLLMMRSKLLFGILKSGLYDEYKRAWLDKLAEKIVKNAKKGDPKSEFYDPKYEYSKTYKHMGAMIEEKGRLYESDMVDQSLITALIEYEYEWVFQKAFSKEGEYSQFKEHLEILREDRNKVHEFIPDYKEQIQETNQTAIQHIKEFYNFLLKSSWMKDDVDLVKDNMHQFEGWKPDEVFYNNHPKSQLLYITAHDMGMLYQLQKKDNYSDYIYSYGINFKEEMVYSKEELVQMKTRLYLELLYCRLINVRRDILLDYLRLLYGKQLYKLMGSACISVSMSEDEVIEAEKIRQKIRENGLDSLGETDFTDFTLIERMARDYLAFGQGTISRDYQKTIEKMKKDRNAVHTFNPMHLPSLYETICTGVANITEFSTIFNYQTNMTFQEKNINPEQCGLYQRKYQETTSALQFLTKGAQEYFQEKDKRGLL